MWRNPFESVAAVAVEGAAKLTVRFTDAVGSTGRQWFPIGNGFGFAFLVQPWFAVWAAETTAVSGGAGRFSAWSGVTFQKVCDRFEGSIVKYLSRIRVRYDYAVARSGKQDDAKRCGAGGAFFDEVTIGDDTNFVLWSPFGVATASADHRYDNASLFQLPPWFSGQAARGVFEWIWRFVAVESGFAK